MKRTTRRASALGTVAALAVTLAACSPGTTGDDPTSAGGESTSDAGGDAATDATTVTFRLWDDVAAPAYEESFDAFTAQNPDITVEVEVVPWGDYWERMPLDIQSGDMADIFWTNSTGYADYADNGNLINITEAIGEDHDEWTQSVVDLYTRDGSLWGVPQIWDSIALYYNKDLVDAAGVDVTDLTWAPDGGEGDTLLPAAQALTLDSAGLNASEDGFNPDDRVQYGFNAQLDMQAIYLDWLAQAGATFQDENDKFAFASPEGETAFQYIFDMVNTWHVAPSAADTNTNGDATRDMFLQGELALFQSGPYNLKTIADNAEFEWGIAPQVAGPEGRISIVHGVAAVGNADTENMEATTKVLEWLGSAEGQTALASQGVSFPAAVDAQQAFVDYWAEQDVDVQLFIDAAMGDTGPAPLGKNFNAAMGAYTAPLQDMMLGNIPVAEALQQAQDAGNAEIE